MANFRACERGTRHLSCYNKFLPWDQRYYERLVAEEFDIDHQKISEFFPLEKTATGMLDLFASLLGLRFDPIQL
ncbi:uncharacterized protein ACLA_081260 [Aspergillus clavatus NRRL 1]|uniref:Peptidase M3A/M3B catalytic domain-containing protein n=1 Tax=Aspergillus clavatus (strain ATCC 1007 / CBS 513.65 / DSM 816 / NCTC 3887 / NRRL 1 / QM 1276 / 107) TaxID=344612 RepID=A1CT01_ASPCL|nr:uncharacterized protein ACLA_081260 [Aspergillus clavatus NRRL 1]EAW06438.1 hypothetical protein ACLA_081260 [Aspergillus clavatus NRRL 1]